MVLLTLKPQTPDTVVTLGPFREHSCNHGLWGGGASSSPCSVERDHLSKRILDWLLLEEREL